jgi:DNA segregation ATPase FtsK/SpoIIIE, S-DNA-T family
MTGCSRKTTRKRERRFPLHLPFIVIVADEMADLMMTAGKEVEQHIIRLAQKSRAVGIHLILATQKPTVDVITGLIKSNLPARIAFQVASRTDSRVVLDEMGADKLLGNGDMLFLWPGTSTLLRGQGTYLERRRDQEGGRSSARASRISSTNW